MLLVVAAAASLAVGLVAAPAQALDPVKVVATINGQPLAGSSGNRPVKLVPSRLADIDLRLVNAGSSPIVVRSVQLRGKVVGLTFFSYATSVSLPLSAGASDDLRFSLDLRDLGGDATGLIPGSLRLLDAQGHVLGSQSMVTDVRGSVRSVYGLFGISLLVLTCLSLGGAVVALARNRLSFNRWLRATRFLSSGIGVGLVLVFTLSAARVFVPSGGAWVVVPLCAGVLFGVGYLTPTPDDDDIEDDRDGGAPASPSRPAPATQRVRGTGSTGPKPAGNGPARRR